MRSIHSKWCVKVHVSCALANPYCYPFCLPSWCVCGVMISLLVSWTLPWPLWFPWGSSFISASGYLLWRIEGRGTFAQNRTGDILRFFLLFPLSSSDHRQYWPWAGHGNICAVCSTQSQMSWPHRTFALSLPSPDNWSHGWRHPCYL